MRLALAILAILTATAAADPDNVTGFLTAGSGELSGVVTDRDDGKPVRNAQVHVVAATGNEQILKTDAAGRYRTKLVPSEYTLVFVYGDVKIAGQVATATTIDGQEAVELREPISPGKQPQPKPSAYIIPPYSQTAIERNVWVRAWLILDIDDRGKVTRVKLINRPGYDLDAIAIRQALKLEFEPARNRVGQPTRSMVVWSYEWPAYYWLEDHRNGMRTMPAEVRGVPCFGSGPTHTLYRDCSRPDLAHAVAQPWHDKP
jgi:carboxypeptidase family protein